MGDQRASASPSSAKFLPASSLKPTEGPSSVFSLEE